jgi:glycine oxidase
LLEGGGQIESDAVVIAAGSWSDAIAVPPNRRVVQPVRGQLVELRLPAGTLTHVVWGTHCYVVPWGDGTVLVGATMENVGFDERTTAAAIMHLRDAGGYLAPHLRDAEFVEARAGLRPATADELPIIGPSTRMPGVYYATGHFRNGVLLAPLTAALIADLVVEGRAHEMLALVRPDRCGL